MGDQAMDELDDLLAAIPLTAATASSSSTNRVTPRPTTIIATPTALTSPSRAAAVPGVTARPPATAVSSPAQRSQPAQPQRQTAIVTAGPRQPAATATAVMPRPAPAITAIDYSDYATNGKPPWSRMFALLKTFETEQVQSAT